MATIELYARKMNQVPSLLNDVKKSVDDYKSQLSAIKTKTLTVNKSVCNLDDVISSIQVSSQTQEKIIDSLDTLQKDCEEFIADTVRVDGDVAEVVQQRKEDFYKKYYYLKPECEKSDWEKFKDGCKKVGEWCKDHWKLLATIVIVVAAIVVVVFFPAAAPVLLLAAKGAIMGAVSGGLIGGLSSWASGGSFWEGFEDGAFSGALTGALFGGLSGAGQMVAGSCRIMGRLGDFNKVFKVVSLTAKVSGGITAVMGGFDALALVIGLFNPSNPLVAINKTLHSSKLYNTFQFSVAAVAAFSSGAYLRMKQGPPVCFVAGTMVLTVSGLVAIENIKAGDTVISTNPDTMEMAVKEVLETYVRETNMLVHLIINDEQIITTMNHPFYVKEHGFIEAGGLWLGANVVNSNGLNHNVENIRFELVEKPKKVYNFQVDEFHTYYAGFSSVLVHNDCKIYKVPKSGSGKERATDIPSQFKGQRPYINESGKEFAKRLCDEAFGEGNYGRGPKSVFNMLQKYADRAFENPKK